jgi:23S rRNA (uracil1939-C5)-methyltransferase
LIGTPYGEQLRRKQEKLAAALAPFEELRRSSVPAIVGSPKAFGYRTQAKLVLRRSRRGVLAGVYRPGTHEVVDIRRCPVHHPLVNQVLAAVCAEIEARDLAVYDERTHEGLLRYVVVRVSSWEKKAQLILVSTSGSLPMALVKSLRARVHGLASVVLNLNPEPGNVILGRRFVPWTKEVSLVERVGDLKLRSRAGAFLQANIPVARKLYAAAAAWAAVTPEDIVADLYCGVGALTFHLAPRARRIFGIEEVEPAVRDAKENTSLNGFHNVRFRCGTAAEQLAALREEVGRIDVISLNPPRKGADEATRRAIVACAPRSIVYVSCEPSTLARDLAWFAGHGYRLARVQGFDMFPQTEHVETLALLEKAATAATPSA